jgi:hypothetical protein
MTGYTVHTGSNEKFSSGWDAIFSGGKPAAGKPAAKGKAKTAKKAAAKKSGKAARKSK